MKYTVYTVNKKGWIKTSQTFKSKVKADTIAEMHSKIMQTGNVIKVSRKCLFCKEKVYREIKGKKS